MESRKASGSRIEGFYRMDHRERLVALAKHAGLTAEEMAELEKAKPLPFEVADNMVENAIGVVGLPLAVALNFLINGRDRFVPMAVEEPSIVAAASSAARLVRKAGGFTAEADPSLMIAQIQLMSFGDMERALAGLRAAEAKLVAAANEVHPNMRKRGGGALRVELRPLPETPAGPMLICHLVVDVGDAMGANALNTMAEAIAPLAEEASGGEARLRILSNLADQRRGRARARIPFELLAAKDFSGEQTAHRLVEAWAFAAADPYRAATHNKGIMNGIDAVAIATGNDWRSIEAGAHAYAARDGRYGPLTRYAIDGDALLCEIELPLAVGIVGGHLEINPGARIALRLLGVESARELSAIMAATGLAQNFAAMRALATDGIQKGHMALHARGLVVAAGAPADLVDQITRRLIDSGEIKLSKAREILQEEQLES